MLEAIEKETKDECGCKNWGHSGEVEFIGYHDSWPQFLIKVEGKGNF